MVLVNTMLFPIFAQMRQSLDIGLREISYLVVVVNLTAAVVSPIGGILADKLGRKKIMIPSILLFGISGGLIGVLVLLMDKPYTLILVLRFFQGVGSAAPMYLAVALAGDIFQDQYRTRAMGFIEMSNGLGKLLSPIIGGALGLLAWYAPFFLFPVVSIPIALLLLFYIKEPPLKEEVTLRDELKSSKHLLERSTVLALLTGGATVFFLIGTMFWLSEILEGIYPEGTMVQGLIIAVPVAGMMVSALISPRYSIKTGPRVTLTLGLLMSAGALILIPLVDDSFLLWPTVIILGISAGALLPMLDTIATAVAARGHRGLITTIFGSFRCLGAAVAPFSVAMLFDKGPPSIFWPMAALNIVLAVALFIYSKEKEMLPPELREGEG